MFQSKISLAVSGISIVAFMVLSGCSGNQKTSSIPSISSAKFKDGIYEEKSSPDPRGEYAILKVKVEGGRIISSDFIGYSYDGTTKGEDYGKGNDENYKRAQFTLKAAKAYGQKLLETQDPSKVDAISGATISYQLFQEVSKNLFTKASK